MGLHLNGFFLRVLLQPTGLTEIGLSRSALLLVGVVGGVLIVVDGLIGARLMAIMPAGRRAYPLALAIVLLSAAERLYGQALDHLAGAAVFAASGVIPFQGPLRFRALGIALFGKKEDPFAGADGQRQPSGVVPEALLFSRRPDVLFAVAESLPHDHFDSQTFPRLWRRTEE